MFQEAQILEPAWAQISNKLGFKLRGTSSRAFLEEWHTFSRTCEPSWENLTNALAKVWGVKKSAVEKVQAKSGTYV